MGISHAFRQTDFSLINTPTHTSASSVRGGMFMNVQCRATTHRELERLIYP